MIRATTFVKEQEGDKPYQTTYGGMNSWHIMEGRTVPRNIPVTMTDGNWKEVKFPGTGPKRPLPDNPRTDEFYNRYNKLIQNVAYKYPNPGPPRERQGRIGGTWRHIKEVLGHGGSRVVFVDGLVRQYDTERKRGGSELDDFMGGGPQLRRSTPSYAANRHDVSSYGRVVQHEFEKRDFKPWQSTAYYAPSTYQPALPNIQNPESGMKSPTKYKGFYTLRRENTYH